MLIIKKMIKFKHVLLLFVLINIDYLTADNHSDELTVDESCQDICSEIHLFSYSRKHLRPVCERGCRFFNIIKRDNIMVIITKNQCHTSCSESYPDKNNLEFYYACITGCDFMADKHFIEENVEMGENTPLLKTYHSFKNYEQHKSQYDDYYRITDTHIKTIPIGHFNNDDILPGIDTENLTLNERIKDWIMYSIHNPIVQKFACFLVTEIVIILLLYRICIPITSSSSKQDALYVSDTQPILLFQISTNQNANI